MASHDRSGAVGAISATLSSHGVEYVVLGCAAVASLCYYLRGRSNKPAPDRPPMAPRGMFETTKEMGETQAPEFLLKIRQELGTSIFQLNMPGSTGFYIVGNAKLQREILTDKTTDRPVELIASFIPITSGKTIFNHSTFSSKWVHARKGSAPAFSSAEVRRMNQVCLRHTQKLIDEYLEPLSASRDPTFDPSDVFPKLAFNVVMEAAFEYEVTDEEYRLFSSNLEVALREFASLQLTDPVRRWFGFLLPEVWEAKACCKRLAAFGKKVLAAYRDNPNKSERNTLIKLIENNPNYESDKAKVSDIIIFLLAGTDTTGYSIASVIILMAMHKDEQYKLRESLVKANDSIDNGMVKSSDYMHQVVTESTRLRPVAAFSLFRKLGRRYAFSEPSTDNPKQTRTVTIPEGSTVMMPQVVTNRDRTVFGDPDVFRPDRWTDPTKDMMDTVMPFSVGNRNCVGQSLAKAELYCVLPKILLGYEFDIVEEGKMSYFLTWKCIGARVRVRKVDHGKLTT